MGLELLLAAFVVSFIAFCFLSMSLSLQNQLMTALISMRFSQLALLFIRVWGDPNAVDGDGQTVLMLAVKKELTDVVKGNYPDEYTEL